ncbi:hypothetical protein SSP24_58210 [Streptomyces spinoverrucosus]|uniref:Uncharacterized protein n=1 Tax=Streptomyces spinoverrucosus TaxID=284043 RepID=A0A4Y3VT74_9ACTN|nr:hypothetical protein SSP24_58210 [Streptomyces spinoverrucosus]GHB62835.1 hypothetical protein GCM10010397_36120 [Streptomyces spinoverrucosus]
MINESALLESKTLRDSVLDRTDVLDRVKALSLLPDGMHVTTARRTDGQQVPRIDRYRTDLLQGGQWDSVTLPVPRAYTACGKPSPH